MTIAVIKDGVCSDICEFYDLQTAQEFLNAGAWEGASNVVEKPAGYGIGDSYADGNWTAAADRIVEEPAEEAPVDKIAELKAENKTLTAKLTAASNQIEMLESCIIEIAQTVYA